MDVFDSVDLLIEKMLDIKCNNCTKKVQFSDIWNSYDLLLEKYVPKCINCKKRVNFIDLVN
jgi:DNA-directed RNA polymerase subunit RPC12/RpoP